MIPRLGPVRVDEIIDSLHPFLSPLAREKGIALRFVIAPDLPSLHTDEDRVRQILLNLSVNAIKFTEQGDVHIRVSQAQADGDNSTVLRFDVQDTGTGIADSDLVRLFKPFSQIDNGPARRHTGTGLGLYISRRLAELLGGHIAVNSTPGVGSTFSLVLPIGY